MNAALEAIEKALKGEKDETRKGELRAALDTLKRQENATEKDERPDYRDPDFKQVANQPGDEELANVKARRNRLEGELPETTGKPAEESKTPPPVET